jgi:hypothetical protein
VWPISAESRIDARDGVGETLDGEFSAEKLVTPGEQQRMKLLRRMYKSGDEVRETGVYAVLHSTPHMLIEHRICFEGGRFRGCRMCPLGVLYRLENQCVRSGDEVIRAMKRGQVLRAPVVG